MRLPKGLAATAAAIALLAGQSATAHAGSSWTTYHADNHRSGLNTAEKSLLPAAKTWSAALDGPVYGQPIVIGDRVIAATENDSVYGLDPHNGAVLWHTTVGTPVPLSTLPCGNIDPLGITSTMVADAQTGTVYAVAEVTGPKHMLVALDAVTGALRFPPRQIDTPNMDPKPHQQRAALALGNGRVYVAFGGLAGDCGNYKGRVVGINEDGGGPLYEYVVPTNREGAIWAPSGPAIDDAGYVYVVTGNSESTTTFDHGQSIIKLDPTLHEVDFFATSTWSQENSNDADLGSTGPLLVDGGLVFAVGKQHSAYLARTNHLGGIGGQAFSADVCSSFGGNAYAAPFIYVDCTDGVRALRLDPNAATFSAAWHGPTATNGPPVVGSNAVWSVDTGAGVLYALDPNDGHELQHLSVGAVPHFASPTIAEGLVLVGTKQGVTAVAGPGGPPPSPSTQGYWTVARDGGVFAFGSAAFHGSTGGIRLAQPVVGMAATTTGNGYWLVASDGGIFNYGDAGFAGSMGGRSLARPVVGMAATTTGRGYWLVASDGGIFAFGDAGFAGSTGAQPLNAPIVGMAATPTGNGYWLVASDGGIFNYGDAGFAGSMGGQPLNAPIVGMAATPTGNGYWLVASDGGIFAFGDAGFRGSMGGQHLNRPIVAMAAHPGDPLGYWLVASDGGIFAFGTAGFAGSTGGQPLNQPMVGMAPAAVHP